MLRKLMLSLLVFISVDIRSMHAEEVEQIAWQVVNEVRTAEKESPYNPAVAHNYQLLKETGRFKTTKVSTELLDREEHLACQKQMLNQQEKIDRSINQLQQVIIQAIQEQTRKLEDTLIEQNKIQIQKLDELIDIHEKVLEGVNKIVQNQK